MMRRRPLFFILLPLLALPALLAAVPASAEDPLETCEDARLRLSFLALSEAKRLAGAERDLPRRESRLRDWFAARSARYACPEAGPPELLVDRAGRFRIVCHRHDAALAGIPRATRHLPDPFGDLDGRPWRGGAAVVPPKRTHDAPEIFIRPRTPHHEKVAAFRRERLRDQILELGDTLDAARGVLLARRDDARRTLHAHQARRNDPPRTERERMRRADEAMAVFRAMWDAIALEPEFRARAEKLVVPAEDRELIDLFRDRVALPLGDFRALAGSSERLFHALPDLPVIRREADARDSVRRRAEAAVNCRAIRREVETAVARHAVRFGAAPATLAQIDPRCDAPTPPCPSGGVYRATPAGGVRCTLHGEE